MTSSDEEFLRRLRATFEVEAAEHLETISSGLLEIEKGLAREQHDQVAERIYRAAHSLKGAARSVNLPEIEAVCQSLESILAELKRRTLAATPEFFDALHRVVDGLAEMIGSAGAPLRQRHNTLIRQLEALARGSLPQPEEAIPPAAAAAPPPEAAADTHRADTVRIDPERLDALLLQAEEMLGVKLASEHLAGELRELARLLDEWMKRGAQALARARRLRHAEKGLPRPDARTDGRRSPDGERSEIGRILDFIDWSDDFMRALQYRTAQLSQRAERDRRAAEALIDELHDSVKRVVMQPFSSLLARLQLLVRDLAREQGKAAELVIEGGEIEADRRVLEALRDPLTHLVRNAVDHGIERPDERLRQGKSERGSVSVSITQRSSSRIEVIVADDGAGIDVDRVRAAAIRQGLISGRQMGEMSEREALDLIFHSGLSTSPLVTSISGRGLGLAIAREKVEAIGGSISIETGSGKGTRFRLLLPLTLATFRGVIVAANERVFVLPTSSVERVLRFRRDEIRRVENREVIRYQGRSLPLVRLTAVLEMERAARVENDQASRSLRAIVVAAAGERVAFAIDDVMGEQEVLVKSLGPQLRRVRNVAGATIIGAGQVIPILNPSDLVRSASIAAEGAADGVTDVVTDVATGTKSAPKSILVVEDSITARTLLKNILEAAGYRVETAVDGIDAWSKLMTSDFDLVVSDVEMPRMHGFNLTEKIRADRRLAELPVILVTALATPEDRERGIIAGANAYLVKSSFDQSNLLEIVRRLA